jgi:tRNA threonylcarbamoyl adenosine modification protein YeaZ
VILAIDTSSVLSAVALLDPSRAPVREIVQPSGKTFDLPAAFRSVAGAAKLTTVAVATGPGSFTGLRVGVSFGLGLAIGLRIPIVPLPSLDIQAARTDEAVLAVAEAGRGRVYYQAPGGRPALGEPDELPGEWAVVGWLRPATELSIKARGLLIKADSEVRSFGDAAGRLLATAREVPYGSLKIAYMQAFSAGA